MFSVVLGLQPDGRRQSVEFSSFFSGVRQTDVPLEVVGFAQLGQRKTFLRTVQRHCFNIGPNRRGEISFVYLRDNNRSVGFRNVY